MKKPKKNYKTFDKKTEKEILRNLDRIHKETQALFEEDKILLRLLKKEINVQQRKAS